MVFALKELAEDIGWGSRQGTTVEAIKKTANKEKSHRDRTKQTSKCREQKRSLENDSSSKKKKPRNADELGKTCETNRAHDSKSHYYGPTSLSLVGNFESGVTVTTRNGGQLDFPTSVVTFEHLSNSPQIGIVGRAKITAIEGSVDIFGFTLRSASQKTLTVESPTWMSSLCISRSGEDDTDVCPTKIHIISMEKDTFSYNIN